MANSWLQKESEGTRDSSRDVSERSQTNERFCDQPKSDNSNGVALIL